MDYMITGGVASVVYGDPRFTRDVDLVLDLPISGVPDLIRVFPTDAFYLPPREVLVDNAARGAGAHFNVIHHQTQLKADIYVAGDDPFHRWALGGRVRLSLGERAIWMAPIEYVIVRKLEYHQASGSERHLRDVAMMLRISRDVIDPDALGLWAERRQVASLIGTAEDFGRG